MSQLDLITIQATSLCNLNCTYCYLPDRKVKSTFDLANIPYIVDNLLRSNLLNDTLSISWHAGEPLILPPSYYNRAINEFRSAIPEGVELIHSLQTNATLLTPEYCELIKEHSIRIGVSIDGPQHIHDRCRKNWANKGTFDTVLKGVELLNQFDISWNAIVVLTDYSLDYPTEIINCLHELGCRGVGFNIEEIEGIHTESSFQRLPAKEKFVDFFTTIFQTARTLQPSMVIREYKKIINMLFSEKGLLKNGVATPLNSITIDTNGDYTVFSPELLTVHNDFYGNFLYGNVKYDLFSDVFNKKNFQIAFADIANGIEACRTQCAYFNVCGGGTPSNKLQEKGTFTATETICCKYIRQYLADAVLKDVESIHARAFA